MTSVRTLPFAVASILTCSLFAAPASAQRRPARQTKQSQARRNAKPNAKAKQPAALACGDYVGFQVLLDRQGISSGEIDGQAGPNLTRALSAFQKTKNLSTTGGADCATWQALGGGEAESTTTSYTLTEQDASGPFTESIPSQLQDQGELPALGYTSALEQIAERFHASPALLQKMNHGVAFAAGTTIQVPAVEPFDAAKPKPAADPGTGDVQVEVSRADSTLRVTRADGTLVYFAPVTTGSEHDPLPVGDWMVTSVDWLPVFHYNPDLFWDAKESDSKATLKPGPNNPVGVVWIGINVEHYGIHGTPAPSRIGHTESHGCVRLTNWDAARVAGLVKRGTAVHFR